MTIVEYYEQNIHSGLYYFLLGLMPLLENIIPLRTNKYPLLWRWVNNFLLTILNSLIYNYFVPILGIAFAVYVQKNGWGLFNIFDVPIVVAALISLLILDANKYIMHWLYHYVPLFWAFHKVHHSDPDYDFTTSFRFHPFESLLGTANSFFIILILGMPVVGVIIFEIMVIAVNFFVHTNIRISSPVEKMIRLFIVTPNMHRIHHSAYEPHTNSNFSIVFPYWDYLAKTYTPVASVDQKNMVIGLDDCQSKKYLNIFWLLVLPFIPKKYKFLLK